MLSTARMGKHLELLGQALAQLEQHFQTSGYAPIDLPNLYVAETLLDLYGEDLRARAFVFADSERGNELCLRPDFTVPVALAHAQKGWAEPARYCYQGPVFRRQPRGMGRPAEYLQTGIERFGDADTAKAEAALLADILGGLEICGIDAPRIITGDLGILFALLDALDMPGYRRSMLKRHFWRPARFQALIEQSVKGAGQPGAERAALLAMAGSPDLPMAIEAQAEQAGGLVGMRSIDEIAERIAAEARARQEPNMPETQARLIGDILRLQLPAGDAPAAIRRLTRPAGVDIGQALDHFETRLGAMQNLGIDPGTLPFTASFGRSVEYYDGFVFEIRAEEEFPPLAGGGRYDHMTTRLGASRLVPAIGAMIRPETALRHGGGMQ